MVVHKITDPKFFAGGLAVFTVSKEGGPHYTFKIKAKKSDDSCVYFAGSLRGGFHGIYSYLGLYNPNKGDVRLTRNSKYEECDIETKTIRWALRKIHQSEDVPEGYRIQHEGRCGRCGKELTDPESIQSGFGPTCRGLV